MKPTRLLLCAALLLGLTAASTAFAATTATVPAKKSTYAIVGYYRDVTPAAGLVDKAVQEVAAKMQGAAVVKDPEAADQVVNVIFKNNAYQIYIGGISPAVMQYRLERSEEGGRVDAMLLDAKIAENYGGHGRGK